MTTDIFDAMATCRAMRHLKPDPVPDDLLDTLVWAGTRAPTPGNAQACRYVVVTDRAKIKRIADSVRTTMVALMADPPPWPEDRSTLLMLQGVGHLVEHLHEAPAVIIIGAPNVYPPGAPDERYVWSAAYPAAQNVLLAARALGLGATMTTFHLMAEDVMRNDLAIPTDIHLAATIVVGWPDREFGPVRRRPIDEVRFRNTWRDTKGE